MSTSSMVKFLDLWVAAKTVISINDEFGFLPEEAKTLLEDALNNIDINSLGE